MNKLESGNCSSGGDGEGLAMTQTFFAQQMDWRNLDASAGKATFRILLPLNGPAGKWRIVVRDALTGFQVAKHLRTRLN